MTEKEHFVPQFYLKGFTGKNGKLSVYHYDSNKFQSINPRNICVKKHLYETNWVQANEKLGKYVLENEIENIFSQYEGEFADLLKKISAICYPTQNKNALILNKADKILLFRFICNLILRNPLNMKAMELEKIPDEIINNELIKSIYLMFEEIGLGSAESLVIAAQKKAALTEEFEGNYTKELIKVIEKLNCIFLYANELEFITSDMPVCYGNDSFIQQEDKTCVYLALTPKIAVLLGNYNRANKFRNRMTLLNTKAVDSINEQTVKNRKEKHFLIARSLNVIKRYISDKE